MNPYYQDNHNTLYNGDCRDMSELQDESVQMCVTSPPYWGLRKYRGVPDLIWGGRDDCEHRWELADIKSMSYIQGNPEFARPHRERKDYNSSSNTCSLCGAWKGSYGLEPTPEMYIEHTVEILREIRRVLRKDGVVFWNIGDSYATTPTGSYGTKSGLHGAQTSEKYKQTIKEVYTKRFDTIKSGLKPKDLCLIPFRVAQEVQKPYYIGKIKDEKDRIWLASMIDGEGCVFIHKRKVGQNAGGGYTRKHDTYGAGLEVANTHLSIINRCRDITGIGSICRVERETKTKKRNIPLYRWNVRSKECRNIIKEVYPYLVGKQHEARLMLGCPSSGADAEKAHSSLIALHNGKEATIDFKPPESLYEPGWYVRSVIIWSKNNPMPESVTDRPTNSHEYILMLTKSAKYYWDADAVREPNDIESMRRAMRGNSQDNKYADGQHIPEGVHANTMSQPRENRGYSDMMGAIERGETPLNPAGRNIRSVWEFPTQPYPEAHFAVFPEKLPEICIKAATPEVGCCSKCGAPWERMTEKTGHLNKREPAHVPNNTPTKTDSTGWSPVAMATNSWQPTCKCNAYKVPSIILDPFAGAGTTLWVAKKLGRKAVGYELSEEYCELALERNRQQVLL